MAINNIEERCYDVEGIEDMEFYLNGSSSDPFEVLDHFHDAQYNFLGREIDNILNPSRHRSGGLYGSRDQQKVKANPYQEKFDENVDQTEAYVEIKDQTGSKKFELMPRESQVASPMTPFSILAAQEVDSDKMFGIRAARTYDKELLRAGRIISDHLIADDLDDLDTDYDSRFDQNTATWIQEPLLQSVLDRPEGVNDAIREHPSQLDPLTRSNYNIIGQREEHPFEYADNELVMTFNWLKDPYSVGPNDRREEAFGRRIATDQALGLDLTLDRSPNEYCLDADKELGRDKISMIDPEFVLFTFDQDRLEEDRRDAMKSVRKGFEAQQDLSGGEIEFSENEKAIYSHVGEAMPEDPDPLRFQLKDQAETGFDMDAFKREYVFSNGWF